MIDETAEEIREMRTHSSSVVAVKAARALEALLDSDYPTVAAYVRALERNSTALRRANPSHASLVTTQREVVSRVRDADPASIPEAQEVTAAAIDDVVARVNMGKHDAAAATAEHITDGQTLLTHDYSSTVLEAIELAAQDGAHLDVFVTEARPRHLGRKTVRALAQLDRVDPTLIVDGAAGHVLDDCDRVLLGMDCIVADTYYNRVGTYPIVAAAADAGTPVTVAGSAAKLVADGFQFTNDFRDTSEVIREPPAGFTVENPAYDATPTRLLDAVVTEDGRRTEFPLES
ncbi:MULTISPECIES: translation initiation factor eIF-2B [Halobacterium]|uniref:Translation initiation factor eIF-2B subunit delta n=4 Tax=Halobacterium salinarum TaxID=2242 RepID=Q9HPV9_HALSA|nr:MULTISPECIES: translation initiation factor eIF-2B [Halobacterium]AAG19758.1 translation initiation factor eIF-2B subunit delta [Halobacterium salinarum NRC-1]MBB6088761.1 translation initiation factor eIF-2B subunit delta [Halobacterium salinarum]MCF2206339.1 translation initiation factor eIF-2B [Halobacterium salinarum]MCF2240020.1 translation initiation factor eIF-2B [Halobacterium salinarum]MDL0119128.1 translation initiation factor eIF-2B [Halobacterium salinarum]